MKELVVLFKKHSDAIENFLSTTIENNSLECSDEANIKSAFKNLASLEAIYLVDSAYRQVTPSYYPKNKMDETRIGANKERYFANLQMQNKNIYVSNPYIHYKTGKPSVTVVKKIEKGYVIFDIDLLMLLEELRLVERNKKFDTFNKYIYALGGYLLSIVSIFLILYGAYAFVFLFNTSNSEEMLHEIFKSIIAITLGLAIHDLAKTIISHEVLFKDSTACQLSQYSILGKFLVSIIIALSIESLMVVFKIVIDGKHYEAIQYAFYLILGATIMIVGLGVFNKFTKDSNCE